MCELLTPAISAVTGIASHRLYFKHGEHHMQATFYIQCWMLITATLWLAFTGLNLIRNPSEAVPATRTTIAINAAFFAGLYASVLIYRTVEHPLHHFPGPKLAKVSKLWHLVHVLRKQNHVFLDDLHGKYGRIVRTGPQELTVFDPDVFRAISGPGTTCIKAPWYDMLHPYVAVNSIRPKKGYAARRKHWDEALGVSSANVTAKTERVQQLVQQFLAQLDHAAGKPLNATKWFYHFAFDVMGDVAFGQTFFLIPNLARSGTGQASITTKKTSKKQEGHLGSQQSERNGKPLVPEPHFAPDLISQGMSMLRFFTPVPWLGLIIAASAPYVPFVSDVWNRALGWAGAMCDARLSREQDPYRGQDNQSNSSAPEHKPACADRSLAEDAFSQFIRSARSDHPEASSSSLNRNALVGDVFSITVAGSHTTAQVLTMLFFELARRPGIQEVLRREVTSFAASERDFPSTSNIKETTYLDGCINESLRLYPPVPSGGIRQTVDKGVYIGDTWIPPSTVIVAPRWTIGRLESAFVDASEFMPERWTTRPELVKNAQAFNAFATGRHACPGKQFGLLEIRLVARMILSKFRIRMAPSDDGDSSAPDSYPVVKGMVDAFTATPGDLRVVFEKL
ncbi:cytochrome P450 [Microdochium trichocladiopsis]|uniref:Cytochrome P450 n=1 Tax=Microdochium trichocladiopsis TaxID=1682393 RepID=A0A9P8YCN6_9PEZI|nr:cytochrome P450 [Microdochium trichocladiopsis]KAH7034608.1 cytochrome P450 [Microdochium trichocladiopsis]